MTEHLPAGIRQCPGCGRPLEWVLWRREVRSEQWEAVAEGGNAEVTRQFAAVPLTEERYRYTMTKPCEPVPGLSAALVSDCGYYEVYDIACDGKFVQRVELAKPPDRGYELVLRSLPGTVPGPGSIEIAWRLAGELAYGWVREAR